MKYDVKYLASDLLEGRETGMPGEKLAVDYIAGKFGNVGPDALWRKRELSAGLHLQGATGAGPDEHHADWDAGNLKQDEKFFPMPFSASGAARGKIYKVGYGIQAPELKHEDLKDLVLTDRIVAISISSPDGIHPHSKYLAYHDLKARAEKVIATGGDRHRVLQR